MNKEFENVVLTFWGSIQSQEAHIHTGEGLLVGNVDIGSPAEKAGIKFKDILLEINGQKLYAINDIAKALKMSKSQKKNVSVKIKREEAKTTYIKDKAGKNKKYWRIFGS
ncbi:MAG: PDZ domain-containing protein [Sulfurospirillum sp.]